MTKELTAADYGPPPAAWSRKHWVGPFSVIVPSGVRFTGVTQHAVPSTNLDVIVDFSQASWALGIDFIFQVAIYVISATGQKIYVSEWLIELPAYAAGDPVPAPSLVIPGSIPVPTPADNGTAQLAAPNAVIIQRGGIAGMVWGIEAGAGLLTGAPPGTYALNNVFIGSIAHGREV